MITINQYGDRPNKIWVELYGLSTDEKPIRKLGTVTLGNGSTFYEMNTKKCFIYDEENHKWWEM